MLNQNWYSYLGGLIHGQEATFTQYTGVSRTKQVSSTYEQTNWLSPYESMANVRTAPGNSGVIFGDGSEPATLSDYKLSGNIISTISSAVARSYTNQGDYVEATAVYTMTNSGTEPITIREVGLFLGMLSNVMVDHTVLNDPVTIPAGGVGQVTYTIRMNYPTA